MKTLSPHLTDKFTHLQQVLIDFQRVAIAFSGGVDSTLLLRVAVDTLGRQNVLALTAVSDLIPAREIEEAEHLMQTLDAIGLVLHEDILTHARVAANPPDRCYHCKQAIFSTFSALAAEHGYPVLLDGANADDTGDWRPGQRAARELGVRSPLLETGMTKADIRQLSRHLDLPTWKKPSYACLASRIPYGTPLSKEILTRVEAAEVFLHDLGFVQMRVRHHDNLARIEVTADDMPRLLDENLRTRITEHLRQLGYQYITLDLLGYRTGSMNEVL